MNITVTDVNEPPAVAGDAAATFNEETGDIATPLKTYAAADPDAGAPAPTWSVAGPDGGKFTATGGALQFKVKPDYENPTDANTDNVYEVTVQATDGNGNRGMKSVKVTVENAEEVGVVTLSKTQPRVGIAVTASLTDPDGSVSGRTWQWSITGVGGQDATPNGDIEDANLATYTPKAGDVGGTLTATASYTDGHDSGKAAFAASANAVAVDTRNRPPAFADQDTETGGLQNDMATRKVDENTKADATDDAAADAVEDTADNVGGVVMATDPDPNAEDLTYTLGGADAAKFRVRANGQIEVGSRHDAGLRDQADLHGDGHGRGLLRLLLLYRCHHHGQPHRRSAGHIGGRLGDIGQEQRRLRRERHRCGHRCGGDIHRIGSQRGYGDVVAERAGRLGLHHHGRRARVHGAAELRDPGGCRHRTTCTR